MIYIKLNNVWTLHFIVCSNGFYGDGCKERCSANCQSDATCNHKSGACEGGNCKAGYQGEKCDTG